MPDDLRFCALGCCYFVNSRPTTQFAYELSARAHLLGLNASEPEQTMIPCAKAGSGINYAVARKLGFYTGLRLPGTAAMRVLGDKNPLVFDAITGVFLRTATVEDLQAWNTARRQALRTVRGMDGRLLPSLHTPLGVAKT